MTLQERIDRIKENLIIELASHKPSKTYIEDLEISIKVFEKQLIRSVDKDIKIVNGAV